MNYKQKHSTKMIMLFAVALLFLNAGAALSDSQTAVDVCNNSGSTFDFSHAQHYNGDSGWHTLGWQTVTNGNCLELRVSGENGRPYRGEIYLYAENGTQGMISGTREFCVSSKTSPPTELSNSANTCGTGQRFVPMKGYGVKPGHRNRIDILPIDFAAPPAPQSAELVRFLDFSTNEEKKILLNQSGTGFEIRCPADEQSVRRELGNGALPRVLTQYDEEIRQSSFNSHPVIECRDTAPDDIELFVVRKNLAATYFLWFKQNRETLYRITCKNILDFLSIDVHDAKENDPRAMPFVEDVVDIDCVDGKKPTTFADWCHQEDLLSPPLKNTVDALKDKVSSPNEESVSCDEASRALHARGTLSFGPGVIEDLRPLSPLVQLNSLDLSDNNIVNIEPLVDLDNLRELNLRNNHIRDIAPLSEMDSLLEVWLQGNDLSTTECPLTLSPNCYF